MAKILVIDDNAIMRKNIWLILKRENYTVLEAADGPTGIAIARAEQPDLVLLDFMLPYMSGESVAKYFHEHEDLQDIPVVMVTAVNQTDLIMNLMKFNIRGYLLKPIKGEVLRERVRSIVGDVGDAKGDGNPPQTEPEATSASEAEASGETEAEALVKTKTVDQPDNSALQPETK